MRSANATVPRTAHAVCKHHSATHRSCGLQTSQCHAPLMRSANITVPRTAHAVCKHHSATHRSCGLQTSQCHAPLMRSANVTVPRTAHAARKRHNATHCPCGVCGATKERTCPYVVNIIWVYRIGESAFAKFSSWCCRQAAA